MRTLLSLAAFASLTLLGAEGEAQAPRNSAATITSSGATTRTPALNDPTIVAIFDEANTADIETGQLAAKKGSSRVVREFGAMLARDHQMVRQQGRDLAQKLGMTPTPQSDDVGAKAHADVLATLRSKNGEDFDRAFLDHEVKFHQDVINAVQSTLLPAISNRELKTLVVKVAPAFEAHRAMAADLRQKMD